MQPQDSSTGQSGLEFVTFFVADQAFCLEITKIQEIRRWTSLTVLPHSPPEVLGVMNLRGSVIPIYDLGISLGFAPTEQTPRSVVVVTSVNGNSIGLLVDAVSEIVAVQDDHIQSTPEIASDTTRDCIDGLVKVEETLARIINIDVITSRKEPQVA